MRTLRSPLNAKRYQKAKKLDLGWMQKIHSCAGGLQGTARRSGVSLRISSGSADRCCVGKQGVGGFICLRGLTGRTSVKFAIFLQKKSLNVLVDHVPKYFGARATVNLPKTGLKGGNTRTYITFSDDLLLLL